MEFFYEYIFLPKEEKLRFHAETADANSARKNYLTIMNNLIST